MYYNDDLMKDNPNPAEGTAALADEAIKRGRALYEGRTTIEAMLPPNPVGSHQLIALRDVTSTHRLTARWILEVRRKTDADYSNTQKFANLLAIRNAQETHRQSCALRTVSIPGYNTSLDVLTGAANQIKYGFGKSKDPVETTANYLDDIIAWSLCEDDEES